MGNIIIQLITITLGTCKRQKTGHISSLIYFIHIEKTILYPTQISPSLLSLPIHHSHQAHITSPKIAGATVLRGFTEEQINRVAAAGSPTMDQHILSPKSKL